MSLALISLVTNSQAALIAVGSDVVGQGTSFTIPVTVSGFSDITTLQFSLAWDPNVIEYSSVGSFGLPNMSAGSFGYRITAPGRLSFSWDDSTLAGVMEPDGSTIFSITFVARLR